MPAAAYPNVFTPLQVGGLTFRNRIVMPAHTTNFGSHHLPTDRHLHYHVARARGGVGAIIFESIRVQHNSLGRPQGVNGYDPACIEPFTRIARAVQAEGAKMLGQVIHLGRQIEGDFERTVSVGPSAVRWSPTGSPPHAMNLDDMDLAVEGHLATVRNLVAAGFDGLELQLGHGHLLQQFLSPSSNIRTDEFGGSRENRMRFPLRVLKAVRDLVGPGFCLGIRVSAEEYIDDGLHLDEMEAIVPALAKAVQIDFVNVSHSAYHGSYSLGTQMADMGFNPAGFRLLPAGIRAALHAAGLKMPVFAVCRFRSIAEAEQALAAGLADAVAMARAHVADAEIVRKTLEGREAEIRTCIGCNQGCAGMLDKNLPIRCTVSPRSGMEGLWPEPETEPASTPLRVLVVGGGPAGMEAAWVAAARGHKVSLWERGDRLGGQLNWIRRMPSRGEFLGLLDQQQKRLAKWGVAVELNREATVETARGFDRVILATGSTPQPLMLPGGPALRIEQALADPDALGAKVAFYDTTGEWSALSVIEHLADLGKQVTVFSPVAGFTWRTSIYSTLATRKRLRDKGVRLALLRKVVDWQGGKLTVEDTSIGDTEVLAGFDSLIATTYNQVEDGLYAPLRALGLEVRMAGDCLAPRTAMEAVYEGFEQARVV